jgi:tetratricopeptide (TPR) repeat protein
MGLLASDLDDAGAPPAADAAAERLPSIDARTDMLLRAVHGPQAAPTAAQRAAARAHILDAMAADLAEQTTEPGPERDAVASEARRPTAAVTVPAPGPGEMRGRLVDALVKLFAPVGEVFAMRAVRMAAVPLLALLVVGSIWTGIWIDAGPSDSTRAGSGPSAGVPTTRGLATPAEADLKREIAAAEAERGPAHPEVASKMADLARLYRAQGRYNDSEALYARALAVQQNALGLSHPDVIRTTRELAEVYRAEGRISEADDLLRRADRR